MKRTILSVAIGSLLALPAIATYAQNCEIDAGNLPKDVQCTKTREQVRAELIAAQRAGEVIVNAELGTTAGAVSTQTAGMTRDQVRAELLAAQRAGEVIVNAELGTTAGPMSTQTARMARSQALAAVPAFATDNYEIDAGNIPGEVSSSMTREQVRAELIAAQRAGDVIVNAELGTTAGAMSTQTAAMTRDQVRAELLAAQRAGEHMINAELGAQAGQLYARAGETYPVSATSPHYVLINLGSASNDLAVYPSQMTLKAGVVYQFVVSNPSTDTHVLAAPELAASANTTELTRLSTWPQRAAERIVDPTATLSKGIWVLPGQVLEWTFTPTKVGSYKFGCESRAHSAAGMFSTVTVTL